MPDPIEARAEEGCAARAGEWVCVLSDGHSGRHFSPAAKQLRTVLEKPQSRGLKPRPLLTTRSRRMSHIDSGQTKAGQAMTLCGRFGVRVGEVASYGKMTRSIIDALPLCERCKTLSVDGDLS